MLEASDVTKQMGQCPHPGKVTSEGMWSMFLIGFQWESLSSSAGVTNLRSSSKTSCLKCTLFTLDSSKVGYSSQWEASMHKVETEAFLNRAMFKETQWTLSEIWYFNKTFDHPDNQRGRLWVRKPEGQTWMSSPPPPPGKITIKINQIVHKSPNLSTTFN